MGWRLCSLFSPSRMWHSFRRVGGCSSGGTQMFPGAEDPRVPLFSQVREDYGTETGREKDTCRFQLLRMAAFNLILNDNLITL